MKKNYIYSGTSLSLTIIFLSLCSCQSEKASNIASPVWLGNMHKLSAASEILVPTINDTSKIRGQDQKNILFKYIKLQKEAADELQTENKNVNADPIIQFLTQEFVEHTQKTISAFEKSDDASMRFYINRSQGYCIACHSRNDRGIQENTLRWSPSLTSLSSIQKTEFFFANRLYGKGIEQSLSVAEDSALAEGDFTNWYMAMQRSFAIIVRVRKSPQEALKLASVIQKNTKLKPFFQKEFRQWSEDIKYWSALTQINNKSYFTDSMNLPKLVTWSKVTFKEDNRYFIRRLMATAEMNDRLENVQMSDRAGGLYYAGVLNAGLTDLNMGMLDRFYFQKCIQQEPHSSIALKCFSRIEQTFSASSFESDNPIQKKTLNDLKELATPVKIPKKLPRMKDQYDYLDF